MGGLLGAAGECRIADVGFASGADADMRCPLLSECWRAGDAWADGWMRDELGIVFDCTAALGQRRAHMASCGLESAVWDSGSERLCAEMRQARCG